MHQNAQPSAFNFDAFQNAKTNAERQKMVGQLQKNKARPAVQGNSIGMGYVFVTVTFDGCCRIRFQPLSSTDWSMIAAAAVVDAGIAGTGAASAGAGACKTGTDGPPTVCARSGLADATTVLAGCGDVACAIAFCALAIAQATEKVCPDSRF